MMRGPTSRVTISSTSPLLMRRLFRQPPYSTFSTTSVPWPRAGRDGVRINPKLTARAAPDRRKSHGLHTVLPPNGLCTDLRLTASNDPYLSADPSLGSSLLPTTVRFRPICTATGTPSISMVVLPLRYQPSEPVENSLTGARCGTSLIVT